MLRLGEDHLASLVLRGEAVSARRRRQRPKEECAPGKRFFQQLWELVDALYSAINHVDGMQGNPETVVELAVALVSYNSPHTTSHSTQPIA